MFQYSYLLPTAPGRVYVIDFHRIILYRIIACDQSTGGRSKTSIKYDGTAHSFGKMHVWYKIVVFYINNLLRAMC